MTGQNTVLQLPLLSTGVKLYQDIFTKCLSFILQIKHKIAYSIRYTSTFNKYIRDKKLHFFRTKAMVKNKP